MRLDFVALAFAAFIAPALAQSSLWGQCGGTGYTGATTCVAGATCVYSNPYYSQCQPSTGSSSSVSSSSTTTKPSSTSTSPSSTSTPSSGKPNYWFSFGDSYTDTGFSISGTQPAVGNPLGNPAYPGNTVTGGPTWIDASTVTYNKSLILTYNLAVSGSTVDGNVVPPYGGSTLVSQVNAFTSWNSATTRPWKAANAGQSLFSFWFGINDLDRTSGTGVNQAALNGDIIYRYFQLVQQLYNLGARNFLFINVPPVDRSPLLIGEGSSAAATEASAIADYNTKLAAGVSAFQANHTGVSTYLFDSHAAFTTILNNPSKYGFVSATAYGQSGDFWGNNLHPASPAQVLIGQQISQLLSSTVW